MCLFQSVKSKKNKKIGVTHACFIVLCFRTGEYSGEGRLSLPLLKMAKKKNGSGNRVVFFFWGLRYFLGGGRASDSIQLG